MLAGKKIGILWFLPNTKSFKNMSKYSEINLGIIATKGRRLGTALPASKLQHIEVESFLKSLKVRGLMYL